MRAGSHSVNARRTQSGEPSETSAREGWFYFIYAVALATLTSTGLHAPNWEWGGFTWMISLVVWILFLCFVFPQVYRARRTHPTGFQNLLAVSFAIPLLLLITIWAFTWPLDQPNNIPLAATVALSILSVMPLAACGFVLIQKDK